MTPLQICHECDRMQWPCGGKCVCTLDCVDIIAHARDGYCPKKKFGDGARPMNYPMVGNCVPPDYSPETSASSPKRRGCCDKATNPQD